MTAVGYCDGMPTAGPRPLIGVTMYRQTTSWWSWERDAALVPGPYLDVVRGGRWGGGAPAAAGAGTQDLSMPIGTTGWSRSSTAWSSSAAGISTPAGTAPTPIRATEGPVRSATSLELGLIGAALAADLPLLAVCRGMQALNVGLGGDLIQQLPDHLGSTAHQPRPGAFGSVAVVTEEGSVVRRLLGARTEVLCSHHQAVDRLGQGLAVTARSEDGVVEALELPGSRFVVGVQWHPEEPADRRLFEALVDAASIARLEKSPTPPAVGKESV